MRVAQLKHQRRRDRHLVGPAPVHRSQGSDGRERLLEGGEVLREARSALPVRALRAAGATRASAVAACDRFIKLHPNHPNVDYAYYLKGVVNFYEDQNLLSQFADQDATERDPRSARDSFAAFKDLATRFPDSKYTPDAIARMNFLVNALASHEVHVARYYMRRGAYIAAANRAQFAVKAYPEAPAVEEALYIMAQAYAQMGMKDLSADAERVLVKNFPKSPWLSGTHVRTTKAWWQIWK
jgi:outer membrane protein assembly factor BamD